MFLVCFLLFLKVQKCVHVCVFVRIPKTGELHRDRLISCQGPTHTSSILKKSHTYIHTYTHTHKRGRWFMGRHRHHKWTGPSSLTNTSIKRSRSHNTGTKTEHCHSPPLLFFLCFSSTHDSLPCMSEHKRLLWKKRISTEVSHWPGMSHKPKHDSLFFIFWQFPFKGV